MKPVKYRHWPTTPGVYFFRDQKGQVIYVGKAKNLQARITQYFQKPLVDRRLRLLLTRMASLTYRQVGSEMEALLLEARLIKQYRPFFNIRLKDDKRYLYVGLTKEKYPRLVSLRAPEKESNLLAWFGPFPDGTVTKEFLRWLRHLYPYRTCKRLGRPCFYYHLGLCPGVCFQPVPEYRQTISKIRRLLNGQIKFLVTKTEKEMMLAAAQENFEKAQLLKKQGLLLQKGFSSRHTDENENRIFATLRQVRLFLATHQGIEPFSLDRIEAYDVANLGKKIIVGSMVVFTGGEADHQEYRRFNIKREHINDPASIGEILARRLKHQDWNYPQLILVDGGRTQVQAVSEVLGRFSLVGQVALLGLAKNEEKIVVPRFQGQKIISWQEVSLPAGSLVRQILQRLRDEAHRFAQSYYHSLYRHSILPVSNSSKN